MTYEVNDSPLQPESSLSIVILSATIDPSLKIRVGDTVVLFGNGEPSPIIHRHVEASTHDDFAGKPVWEPLTEELNTSVLRWAIDELVRNNLSRSIQLSNQAFTDNAALSREANKEDSDHAVSSRRQPSQQG